MTFNRRTTPVPFSMVLSCLLFCSTGVAAPARKGAPSAPSLGASMQGIVVDLPDPKFPGKSVPLCHVRAASATGQSAETGFLGSMTQVSALLYQQGKAAATLTAPRADGNSLRKAVVVTARGGVVVKSLTQAGTKLTADTVVWYAGLNKIVATGHVFYRDGKTGATMTGPVMNADTNLKMVSLASGVHARMPF